MEYIDIIMKLASLPLNVILMVVAVALYKQNLDLDKEGKVLLERYHLLVAEQVKTLNDLAERLK